MSCYAKLNISLDLGLRALMLQGEKNVQSDRGSNPGPHNTYILLTILACRCTLGCKKRTIDALCISKISCHVP